MIASTVVIHVLGIIGLIIWLRGQEKLVKQMHVYLAITVALVSTILCLFLIHTIEIWLWAALYIGLGEFVKMDQALYFSSVTFTTLGYGDVVLSDNYKLMGGLEAVNDIILFGVSTAVAFAALRTVKPKWRWRVPGKLEMSHPGPPSPDIAHFSVPDREAGLLGRQGRASPGTCHSKYAA